MTESLEVAQAWGAEGDEREMLISPGNATKILGLPKDFIGEQINRGSLRIAAVFNGTPRIEMSEFKKEISAR